ncbi:hypothetical protein AAG570_013760 [Ranatra chinensis]|uniref:Dynein heavy chain tail domain-containing protein n=1 Tax=Ranatra chinensis TaxID=642074 RepID=A0ABD0YDE5_9HEMI
MASKRRNMFQKNKTQETTENAEIDFWASRVKNLDSVYNQLSDPRVKKMAFVLEQSQSVYMECFNKLFKNVVAALTEAREVNKYLTTLTRYLDQIESTDLWESQDVYRPFMHTICLVWVHCPYYRSSTRIINFMKETCNMMITESDKFLDPPSLFQGEVEETLPKLAGVLKNLTLYKNLFLEYYDKLPAMFPEGEEPVVWQFHQKLIFEPRFDPYFKRLSLIEYIFTTAIEYLKLEKVEIGGYKARTESEKLVAIFEEFNNAYAMFANLPYNPGDFEDPSFDSDLQKFDKTIKDLDWRLAAIIRLAFDDCTNFESIFKDIQSQKGGKLHLPFSVVSCVLFFWNMFRRLDAILCLSDCG